MSVTRRKLLSSTLAAGAALAGRKALAQGTPEMPGMPGMPAGPAPAAAPVPSGKRARGLVAPNGSVQQGRMVRGVRVFHLRAAPLEHEIAPGLRIDAWGYNGTTPGPVLEAFEGERVRIYVTNALAEPTSIHWHGMLIPNGMDGVGGLTQRSIGPGQTYRYEFPLVRAGTYMYHPHVDEMTQIALGMMGMFVVHPRAPEGHARDYALMAHEMKVPIGTARPDPLAMNDFNVLTFNGKSFPATQPLVAQTGERVRIRLANLGPMEHHPIHLHGHYFELVATDGGPVPPSARHPETTILVPVGTVRVIELVARAPGDWPMHCHMTHHAMNQMGHDAANLIGADISGLDAKLRRVLPGYMTMGHAGMDEMANMRMPQPKNSISMLGGQGPYGTIDMGGMFTMLKIRDRLTSDADPGWYKPEPSEVAAEAAADELARDGIDPDRP